jgi:hypothetical protein
MTDITVTVDPAALRDLWRSWDGPVGQAVGQVTAEVEEIARFLAPVSATGSKFAPPGYLKSSTRESAERHYSDDRSSVMGLVGASRYPFNFISAKSGYVANPRSGKHPGRASSRRADDDFLARAIDSAPHIIIGRKT